MQTQLIAIRARVTMALAISAALVLQTSCGWEPRLTWPSPNGKAQIQIEQKLPVNLWGLRVVLVSGGQTTLLKEQRGDSLVEFADVYWEKDNSAVAIYACGIQKLRVAYSLNEGQPLAFDRFESKVAAHIRTEYGLPNGMSDSDVFIWTCGKGSIEAFSKKHPEAR